MDARARCHGVYRDHPLAVRRAVWWHWRTRQTIRTRDDSMVLVHGDHRRLELVWRLVCAGSVFPSITGAEALYSDMGHVGRRSIYVTWPSVCVCLMLSYFGQGAWMLGGHSQTLEGAAPFFQIIPESSRPVGAIPALLAGVTASQALISGAFKNPARQGKHKQLERIGASFERSRQLRSICTRVQ